ncbi:outer membrane protein assembly factor BamB family protein [Streptomyces fuscigenes]|uniref:outer membrane protein assembly factor BamB family protein n=1 Tax=Streptomyces fuscigenes TaxID=1528880 RepID=UPI001F1EC152|nr:PQQ-binding-like beta-propeller repeat protein [Streptomyces fuscigenes]MCF3964068.1 PQQ-like beta-propeller repeat protein [Streptomyces fuscigenes]
MFCAAPGVPAARLDAADGKIAWSLPGRGSSDTVSGDAGPVLSGGLLYVTGTGGQRLQALDPATGRQRWSASLEGFPTVRHAAGTAVLVSADGRTVRALDGRTGAPRWTRRLDARSTVWTDPSGTGQALYAVAPTQDGTGSTVSALDPATGRARWSTTVAGTLSPVHESGPTLWALSQRPDGLTDSVVRIGGAAGASTRRVPLPNPVDQAQATVSGGIAYVMSYAGALSALDTREGAARPVLWTLETAVTRASRPTADGAGHVFVTAGDGRLLAVDAARGTLLAQTAPRLGAQRSTVAASLPAPVLTAGGREVVAAGPDGSVLAGDARHPSDW